MIPTDEHGDWATIPEAATIRGVTEQVIYRWTYRKNIRKHRIEGRIHVCLDDIDAYLTHRAVQSRTGR